ncbi:HDIG domain-containing protein [Horticoccus luteus]|uniref:HDIG domain-containing protein n=1 Tax=Horticoccus luteus TaxID=2862869 RepID=A0A8F9TY92_9BACT|nr:HDIG domain-containing metalloprotein [Horticoccus luteus]QYM80059.1 HDIG domain-containing protein [Horticoccus luteus]
MSFRDQLTLLLGGLRQGPPRRGTSAASLARDFLDRSRLIAIVIFLVTVGSIVLISSVGMSTLHVAVLPNQLATTRIVASAPFDYISAEQTRAARDAFAARIPPVYRLTDEPARQFDAAARDFLAQLNRFDAERPPGAPMIGDRQSALAGIVDAFNSRGSYRVSLEDAGRILSGTNIHQRTQLFESGLAAVRDIYAEGVHDSSLGGGVNGAGALFEVVRPGGDVTLRPTQSLEDALTFLRVSLAADGVSRPVSQALFRFFRNGIAPNLLFDRAATERRQAEAARNLKPIVVHVAAGQTIIESGERVTPAEYEMFGAYRKYLLDHGDVDWNEGLALFGRVLLVLAMVLASIIYIRLEDPETLQSNVRLGLLALVVILNLALVRAVYSIGGVAFFVSDGSWASTLPYIAPTAFAPLIVAILIDAGSAIFMALLISIFTGVIYGNRLDLLVLTFLASLVAIFSSRDAHRRGRVVRAAGAGGLTVAAFAALIGIADQVPIETLGRQMGAGLVTGLLTGIAVVGLLPVLESLFKRTTDITLLELTDYNHPLLRRMQLEAPGTYHHSLIVAQLAENACSAIGANPLLARVCALFHDIGKVLHPLYFSENQRDRGNPHDHHDPVASARIIKQHVSQGLELAQKHHLPRAVRDVIEQHHGTTLVRFFYERARTASSARAAAAPAEEEFRYDGPLPQFKECAVISLADGVEAASRSLRQATADQLTQLIDHIVRDRIAEGQLDEAPLTFAEIARIKESFIETLLNMLHGRIAYPAATPAPFPVKA